LTVDDAQKTTEFYRDVLGFQIERSLGNPPYYVVVRRDGVAIHFSEREDVTVKIQPCHVYVLVSDVDAVYQELDSKGVRLFSPPENSDHGMREFEATDPNGHFLTFGQPV
jgi:catechol 2,3-dioxygenase-like lactoylglutathione lyase family enzyme